ncbi:MAG: hypothetical protein IKE64_12475, partial [Thermoguttaceae bacterium]|nr:hypothetical protein [Thermoguttaceae bacterium]
KRKESNYLPTNTPTTTGAGGKRKAQPPKERVGEPPAPIKPPDDAVRSEVVRILIPPGDYSIDRDLIDRTVSAIRDGVPGLTARDLKRIAKKADDAVALYDRSDGRRGKQYRWQTIADEIHARFRSVNRPWSDEFAGENEPPPAASRRGHYAQGQSPAADRDDVAQTEDPDTLIAQLRDRKTDPAGEDLGHTARRLKCTLAEAMIERDTWRKLKRISSDHRERLAALT